MSCEKEVHVELSRMGPEGHEEGSRLDACLLCKEGKQRRARYVYDFEKAMLSVQPKCCQRCVCQKFRTRLTTTRDRNLQFGGSFSTEFLNFLQWILSIFSRFPV